MKFFIFIVMLKLWRLKVMQFDRMITIENASSLFFKHPKRLLKETQRAKEKKNELSHFFHELYFYKRRSDNKAYAQFFFHPYLVCKCTPREVFKNMTWIRELWFGLFILKKSLFLGAFIWFWNWIFYGKKINKLSVFTLEDKILNFVNNKSKKIV